MVEGFGATGDTEGVLIFLQLDVVVLLDPVGELIDFEFPLVFLLFSLSNERVVQ
jgi:hypothetical protein